MLRDGTFDDCCEGRKKDNTPLTGDAHEAEIIPPPRRSQRRE